MFKQRSGSQGGSGPAQAPSIESIRRQARQRLIGASVLVMAGVIGLPWLFDTQPRPVPVDIAIDIPAKDKVAPLVMAEPATRPAAVSLPTEREEVLPPSRQEPVRVQAQPEPVVDVPAVPSGAVSSKVPATPQPLPAPAAPSRPTSPAVPATSDAARAQALLDGRSPSAATARVVVQVGAFAEQARAQEVRLRLERAGLKTYTQVAQTAEGPRIRVRLGPFDTRAEAERAAEKVKQLGLPASILTL